MSLVKKHREVKLSSNCRLPGPWRPGKSLPPHTQKNHLGTWLWGGGGMVSVLQQQNNVCLPNNVCFVTKTRPYLFDSSVGTHFGQRTRSVGLGK